MTFETKSQGLRLANELSAKGQTHFTFDEAVSRLKKTPTATANLLQRMMEDGLVDRVRHGHYVLRALGVLGTPSAAEDIALAVRSAFQGVPHRLAYRTALFEHDLISHPLRIIQVASSRRTRTTNLSGWSLKVVLERSEHLSIGSMPWNKTQISDIERAVLDAAHRPLLVGGIEVVAESLGAAVSKLRPAILMDYASNLNRAAALRRIGSLADNLELAGLQNQIKPIKPPTSDIELEPGATTDTVWRDARWRLRWPFAIEELQAIVQQ